MVKNRPWSPQLWLSWGGGADVRDDEISVLIHEETNAFAEADNIAIPQSHYPIPLPFRIHHKIHVPVYHARTKFVADVERVVFIRGFTS